MGCSSDGRTLNLPESRSRKPPFKSNVSEPHSAIEPPKDGFDTAPTPRLQRPLTCATYVTLDALGAPTAARPNAGIPTGHLPPPNRALRPPACSPTRPPPPPTHPHTRPPVLSSASPPGPSPECPFARTPLCPPTYPPTRLPARSPLRPPARAASVGSRKHGWEQ